MNEVRTIRVNIRSGYDIIIGHDILKDFSKYYDVISKAIIITDDNIPNQYINEVKSNIKDCFIYTIKNGEASKNITCYQEILKFMLDKEFTRFDTVIAIGGGVVGDLAGFVASTYKRGVNFVNIPTSTLACVDSSVGGKVAVNLGGIKNVVGTFYQPQLVLIDINTLSTLPKRHYYNGLVEALKMGLIKNKNLYSLFLKDIASSIDEIIYLSVLNKKNIVEADEEELGIRKILNFGHTIGHGIESVHLGEIYHGEAVAYGMIPFISDAKLKEEVLDILRKMDIVPKYDCLDEVYKVVLNDKKREKDIIKVITCNEVGSYIIKTVTIEEMYNIIKEAFNGISNR